MSYPPPPPGTGNGLPPRPPPPANPGAFAGFRPRQVPGAASTPTYSSAPSYSAEYSSAGSYPTYSAPSYPAYSASSTASAPSYGAAPVVSAAPQMVNPFPLPGTQSFGGSGAGGRRNADPRYADLDPELQAQIAQQQSIYDPTNPENLKARSTAPKPGDASTGGSSKNPKPEKTPTVVRHGGGETWQDPTLLEWDPSHFRLFVGNLAGEVTDDSLLKAFSKYPSVKKARVVRDKRTTKSKGYGFVAFSDGDEYFRAAREMNGKYIGSHPVLLKRSNTEIKPVVVGSGKGGKTKGGRVEKNKGKKKNKGDGRKVLG